MSSSKLEVLGVSKSFPGTGHSCLIALREVSLTVQEGEFVSMIGPSGSGKSSLLDLISGLSNPDSGEIRLDGQSIIGQRGIVSYMPQKDVLFPWRTILENVIIPLEIQGIQRKDAIKEAKNLLPVFGLDQFGDHYPHMLSGGMRQRAAFLRTHLSKSKVMLLDEPFGKLDALTRMQMQQWLIEMWQTMKTSVLMVTHDVDEAILLSDRIYVLSARPGEILSEVQVDIPRPRRSTKTIDGSFLALKSELLNLLQESIVYS